VLIDSNFKDIKSEYSTQPINNKVYKITSTIFNDLENNVVADKDAIQDNSIKAFLNVINPNVFTNAFVTNGGTKPPEDILKMLTNINNRVNNMLRVDRNVKLTDIIFNCTEFYMNNRIGTILKQGEITSIQKSNTDKFSKGQMIVREFRNDNYEFVLFKEYVNNNQAKVLTDLRTYTDKKRKIIELTVDVSSLYYYTVQELNQDYVNKINFSEEYLLETYIIDSN